MNPATQHGGALDAAIALHGGRRTDWLDLSTGMNPAPPSLPELAAELWTRLPERALEEAALDAARRFYGVPDKGSIVAAPGSQALISALPHLFAPTVAAVLEPTYTEHRTALASAGHRVQGIADLGAVSAETRMVVVVNPNNPDGRLQSAARLLALADELAARAGLLIVDEAFMDVDPGQSLASHAGREGLLVHRSFGKFFGYGGLRLGFALGPEALCLALADRFGPWATSGPALAVAAAFMGDGALVDGLRETIRAQAARLRVTLCGNGLQVVGETPLFALVHHDRAQALFEALCRRHILTRPFAYRADWLRFGNPADEADAIRLGLALRATLAGIGSSS